MKMKKYIASSMAAAMKKVQVDLGDDAIIASSKVVYSKGFLGMFKKKSYEVVAGIERKNQKETMISPRTIQQPIIIESETTEKQTETIKKELADLKTMMESMKRRSASVQYPDELADIIEKLEQQEINHELITQIGDGLFTVVKNSKNDLSQNELQELAKKHILSILRELPFGGISYDKKYINVLGPTGVGKTTTIAKMAARAVLQEKKKIGFITTDTYRIAAIEQLKTYANLLQAPVEIVYSRDDYEKALRKFEHLDLIFIDTAGRNYKEAKYIKDLQQLIDVEKNVENYLVLSLTAKERDMATIIEQFLAFPVKKLIFTKLDETNTIGSMINLMVKYKKGLAYYTNGQEVPEDIEEASMKNMIDLLFQGDNI
ncbi:flagellar biosynthesis protein FlhF [Rummeliibacillus pycnus]|uniref:flagellar biosynthesis protein FlhF n=1 Tax=Rummeliibacillus pycnus TaxID=101070 RepID=UPI003D2AD314